MIRRKNTWYLVSKSLLSRGGSALKKTKEGRGEIAHVTDHIKEWVPSGRVSFIWPRIGDVTR